MAANFQIADKALGAPVPVSLTSTEALYPLGMSLHAVDKQSGSGNLGAGVFAYLAGSDVASVGQFVQIQGNNALLLNANNSVSYFPVGVAAGVLSATNVYGWVQVAGMCDYAKGTDSTTAAGAPLYICSVTDSGGYLLSDSAAGNCVHGAVLPVVYSTSQSDSMTVQLNYPFVAGVVASI